MQGMWRGCNLFILCLAFRATFIYKRPYSKILHIREGARMNRKNILWIYNIFVDRRKRRILLRGSNNGDSDLYWLLTDLSFCKCFSYTPSIPPHPKPKRKLRKCRKRHRKRYCRRKRKRTNFRRVKLVLKVTNNPTQKRWVVTVALSYLA